MDHVAQAPSPVMSDKLRLRLQVASLATGLAVIQAVCAKPRIDLPLTEAAILLAFTALFGHVALGALELAGGSHRRTVARHQIKRKFRW
ncbi:MAG: hypothetical protein AUH15_11100 [Acidobacteriales bacterium 13_2_20CM_55_8]|nr:MAG: hypothetical protein AUH15_11100 [Acidobacteriales bacterium 13_2_20CM_55_8]